MTTSHPAATQSALEGESLHAFMDQAHELLHQEDGAAAIALADRQAAVMELLSQQRFAPATVGELERLHDLWLDLERPETANTLLREHRDTTLLPLQGDTRLQAMASLALSEIQSRLRFDRDGGVALLGPAAGLLGRLPHTGEPYRYWNGWHYLAREAQAWDLAEQGVDLQRSHERSDPDGEASPALRDARACLRKAGLARLRGDAPATVRQVQAATAQLTQADAGQNVDFDDWLHLAREVLPLAPQSVPAVLMAAEQHLARTENPAASQAVRTHRKVHAARLQAMACHAMGQPEAALQLAAMGRFGLVDDSDDAFSGLVLQWLEEAGRLSDAADLALESVLHSRPGSARQGYELALRRVEQDTGHAPAWALILAWSGLDPDMQDILEDSPAAPRSADDYLALARAQAPGHPLPDLIEGWRLARNRQWEQALPLLERGVGEQPRYANSELLPLLWAARFAVLPAAQALQRPFPQGHGAHWCYAAGVVLDDEDDLAPIMGEGRQVPPDEVCEPLVQRYYEEGLARFEAFWASGQGMYKDAHLHVYSMLCNNLAIKYRMQQRYDEAAALHHKGLSSSPFAEHHDGLLWCAIGKDDRAGIVTAALALYQLGRAGEIGIWLERLDQWFEELDDDDRRAQRRDYLAALMSLLDYFSENHGELVRPRLDALLPEVRALGECYTLRRLACAMESCGPIDQAVALHREAIAQLTADDSEQEHRMAKDGLQRCLKLRSGSKPWWKLW
jgi:tetratricopeptide (TPR) repeat protein